MSTNNFPGDFLSQEYAVASDQSNSTNLFIATSNTRQLGKVLKVKTNEQAPASVTNGWISLIGDSKDGLALTIPLSKISNVDLASLPQGDATLYLDNSSNIQIKIGAVTKQILTVGTNPEIPVVTTLPDPSSFPTNTTTLVVHKTTSPDAENLKWYNSVTQAWVTIPS